MKKTVMATALAGSLAGGLVGCGSQAGPGYEGETLFQFGAKVVVENPDAPADLVPAIAFVAEHEGSDAIFPREVSYEGIFPNDVRLRLYERPPEEAFLGSFGLPDEPRMAQGYITAITRGTPPFLRFDNEGEGLRCNPDPEAVDHGCVHLYGRCAPDHDANNLDPEHCYIEESPCSRLDDPTCPTTRAYGNEEYARSLAQRFAGLSVNVAMIYLDGPAARRSLTSYFFNQGRAVGAGYHLLRWTPASAEEQNDAKACVGEVTAGILDAYNAEHGTEFDDLGDLPNVLPTMLDAARAAEDRGCPIVSREGYMEVVDVGSEPRVTIEVSAEGNPFRSFGPQQGD